MNLELIEVVAGTQLWITLVPRLSPPTKLIINRKNWVVRTASNKKVGKVWE